MTVVFDNDRDEMLQACFDAGVEYIMIPGVDRGTVESGLALANSMIAYMLL